MSTVFDDVEACVAAIRGGGMVVVADDENRENEGDLILAAEKVTPEAVNFMTLHGRGLVCVPLTRDRLQQLGIARMPLHNRGDAFSTAFMESVDATADRGVTTGISAADRAATIRMLVDPASGRGDWVSPGHVFPLEARDGGTLVRAGHTGRRSTWRAWRGSVPPG